MSLSLFLASTTLQEGDMAAAIAAAVTRNFSNVFFSFGILGLRDSKIEGFQDSLFGIQGLGLRAQDSIKS